MYFYKFMNIIVFFFLLEVIIHSSADDWKKLRKKLIALSILNGLRIKKTYLVPFPLPLPLPVIIKKSSQVILPGKKYPVLVPKPMPVYQLVPKFMPTHHKEKMGLYRDPYEHKYDHQSNQYNNGWDQDWLQNAYLDNMQMNQFMLGNDGQQEVAMPSFINENKYNYRFHDNQQDYQGKSSSQHIIPDEVMRGRRNRKMFSKQDFRSFQDIGFNDYYNDEDLLMSSTETKTRNPSKRLRATRVKNMKPDNKYRDLNPDKTRNNRFPAKNKSIEGLPVSADEIKHILSDLKSIDDDIKMLPNRHTTTDPPIKTSIRRVKVGEIRLRPQQLRSLLSNSKLSFD